MDLCIKLVKAIYIDATTVTLDRSIIPNGALHLRVINYIFTIRRRLSKRNMALFYKYFAIDFIHKVTAIVYK